MQKNNQKFLLVNIFLLSQLDGTVIFPRKIRVENFSGRSFLCRNFSRTGFLLPGMHLKNYMPGNIESNQSILQLLIVEIGVGFAG